VILPRDSKRMDRGFDDDDDDDDEDDVEELERKMRSAELPEHAFKVAMKELKVGPFSKLRPFYSIELTNCKFLGF